MAEGSNVHISFVPDQIATIGDFVITNTFVASILATFVLITVAFFVSRRFDADAPGAVQNFFEAIFDFLLGYVEDVLESREQAVRWFPLLATIFLFIWIANWMEFLPGFGAVQVGDVHALRSANTDLNMTLALALVAFVSIEIAGFRELGIGYLKKFFTISGHSIGERLLNFFIGLIELVSEFARLVSLSFRLLGNIFAGEILILLTLLLQGALYNVIKLPIPFPVPIMLFEMGVGLIQAVVFAMLTLYFIKIAMTPAEH